MNADLWQRVTATFDSALQLPPAERGAYLERSCGNDADLRSEVARLLAELEKARDFLETPLIQPRQALSAGELVAGRYRMEALIGRGGMGEVYRAQDELLGDPVALKTLRPEFTGNAGILRRLQREVQLARRVTHPNICRVFDMGAHKLSEPRTVVSGEGSSPPLHFFTMELLDGETLAARVRRSGPMAREEAFPLILQMADGLAAAHQAGIIHRDFKSSNVMLTGDAAAPRAVITDFGLAGFDSIEAAAVAGATGAPGTLTANAQVAGTVAYMSPEQLSGGEVTAASDIYSLGVVLYEMATGQLPFDSRHIIQSAMQRAGGLIPSVRTHAPKIDPRWESAITRCLHRDPAKRFPTAAALATHFRQWRPHPAYWTRRQWTKATAVAGISATGASLPYAISRLRYRDLEAGAKIVMVPTLNATGEERFNGLATALRTSVGQSARFNLWDNQRLTPVLQSMRRDPNSNLSGKDWREIAFREGAPLLVFSTLSRVADGYSLVLRAEQIGAAPEPPLRAWDKTVPASSPNAIFDAIHTAASWVRSTSGETPVELSAHNHLPQDITSSDWEALRLYDQGMRFRQSGRVREAIPFLRRAIDKDSHFATALMHLGDILAADHNIPEGLAYWKRAIDEGRAQRLAERERLNLESRYAQEIGDFSKAEPILREWMEEFPNDPRPGEWLVPALRNLGRYPESIEVARLRNARFPPTVFSVGQLIHSLAFADRLGEARVEAEHLHAMGARAVALRFKALLSAAEKDYEPARRYLDGYAGMVGIPESSHVASLRAHLVADRGDLSGAIQLLETGIEADKQADLPGYAALKASGLAYLSMRIGKPTEASAWALEAVSLQPSDEILVRSISILAQLGQAGAARRLMNRLPPAVGGAAQNAWVAARAEMKLAEGHAAEAARLLDSARSPFDAAGQDRLARMLLAAGQKERAGKLFALIARSKWLTWARAESEWPGLRYFASQY